MQILDLLGMYFDAAVLFVTSQTLLLRLALAILCHDIMVLAKLKFGQTLDHLTNLESVDDDT